MFPAAMQGWAKRVAETVVSPLAERDVHPNVVTIVGFILNLVTAAVLATGHLSAGGVLLLVSGMFDMLDGALARVAGSQSVFGAFLDSLLDRYSEAMILLALLYVFATRHETADVLLVYAVAIGSLLISYARARAEGLGLEAKVGIAPRPERVILLGLGLLINGTTIVIALVILALLTHITALQRLVHVWLQTRRPVRREPSPTSRRGADPKESQANT